MKKFTLLLSVASTLTCLPPAVSAEETTVFGFTFGQKIEAPQCGGTELFPLPPNEGYCLIYHKVSGYQGQSTYTGFVSARFKAIDLPFWTGGGLTFYLIDGKVEGFNSTTGGTTTNLIVISDLIKKFGKPTGKIESTVQNGFGATFDSSTILWDLPNVKIKYFPIFENLKSGRLDIFSATGYAARQKAIKASETPPAREL